jgi:hypothetical protein
MELPSPEQLKNRLVLYVGRWLQKLGLNHRAVGKNAKGMYALEIASVDMAFQTMKRRGREFVESLVLVNSLPTSANLTTSPPFDPLPVFRRALERGILTAKAATLAKIREWIDAGNRTMLQKAYELMPNDMKVSLS